MLNGHSQTILSVVIFFSGPSTKRREEKKGYIEMTGCSSHSPTVYYCTRAAALERLVDLDLLLTAGAPPAGLDRFLDSIIR